MITKSQAKLIRRLRARKRREGEKAFLIEGVRAVEELLRSELTIDLLVTAPNLSGTARGRDLLDRIEKGDWARAAVSDEELRRLASTESPQGVLAVALKVSASLEDWEPAGEAAILVFDRLSDPGNLGTLLRAAHGLGADWAVTLPGSVDPWNPKAVRASAGSLFSLPVSQEPWSLVVAWLRRHDFTILCADPDGQTVPRAGVSPAPARFALVVGSEPTGLSDEVRAECQRLVAIDLVGGAESLNAAIAGALLLDRLLSG